MKVMDGNGEAVKMHIPETTQHSHILPIIGVIIIMLTLTLGGLLLWGWQLNKQANIPVVENVIVNNEPETPRADADTQILETLSPSDELNAIEADLESTNLDSLDTDLTSIDTEIDAALVQ